LDQHNEIMNAKKILLAFMMFIFILASGFTQEGSRKAKRKSDKIEHENQIGQLINSREFDFIATRALPQDGGSVDLTTNSNFIKFHPDCVVSYMPFYGRAYHVDYGGDGGIKFDAKPKEFKVTTRNRGKGYAITISVPVSRDCFQLNLIVSPDGSATLTISSNDRSTITYFGDIVKPEAQAIK